jgi:2-polyprenyl-3-methyl-5-hydroxy-6-metoxy-1,4-benzoquinol methylase
MPPMHSDVIQRLLEVNATFYQAQAANFAQTRRRPQPGVVRVLESLDAGARILDVGCGHGVVAGWLERRGHAGGYTGIDASQALLEQARQAVHAPQFAFKQIDLAMPGWPDQVPPGYSVILAFAVLHHLPGEALRRQVVADLAGLLLAEGRIEVSVWDLLGLERLRRRQLPWERIGLTQADVEPGDYLLDWRHGGHGLRYVHHFTPAELTALADTAGLRATDVRASDGENGRLGMYQSWFRP